jgi:hypothetical protein
MDSDPIDYAAPLFRPSARRLPIRVLVVGFLVAVLLMSLIFLPCRQTQRRMDGITGSVEQQTTWPLGISTPGVVAVSPLEIRLRKMGVQWNRDWRMISTTDQTIFGNVVGRGCGTAPPIFPLTTVLAGFVAASDDNQIRQFVRILQVGTEADQRKAIDAAGDRALESTQSRPLNR